MAGGTGYYASNGIAISCHEREWIERRSAALITFHAGGSEGNFQKEFEP
jgi:hypothetical protein